MSLKATAIFSKDDSKLTSEPPPQPINVDWIEGHLVGGVLALAAVSVHLDEVEGPVEAAVQLRHVDVERKLAVQQIEHAVPWEGSDKLRYLTKLTICRKNKSQPDLF